MAALKFLYDTNTLRIKKYFLIVFLIWTTLIIFSVIWNIRSENEHLTELVKREARVHFKKDKAIRYWASKHGGIYVAKNERTPSNKYLSHMEFREITTPSGDTLTLMNPAYIVRQMFDEYPSDYGAEGRIVSRKPLNINNLADPWETKALESFDSGQQEAMEFSKIGDKEYLRLMRPMVTEESCLKCHVHQGYKVGDIRGGVGVLIETNTIFSSAEKHYRAIILLHMLLLIVGYTAIFFTRKKFIEYNLNKKLIEESLQISRDYLESVLNNNFDVILSVNKNYKLKTFNKLAAESFYHYFKVNLETEKSFFDFIPEEFYESWKNRCDRAFAGEYFEVEDHHNNGGRLFIEKVAFAPINSHSTGEIMGVAVFSRDITDSYVSKKNLEESEKQLSLIFNGTDNFVVLVHVEPNNKFSIERSNNKFIEANRSLGIDIDMNSIIGLDVEFFLKEYINAHDEKIESIISHYQYVLNNKKVLNYEEETIIGKYTYLTDVTLTPIINENNECTHILYVAKDITERNKSEADLNAALVENKKKVRELEKLYKQIENEQNAALNLMEDLSEEIKERKSTELELNLHKENLEQLVEERTEQIRYINKQLSLEIENKIEGEEKVQNALRKEQQVNELKTRFISTVSHEVRTPLTAIKSSADLLQRYSEKWDVEKRSEHLSRINNSVDYLTTLLENVLTMSRTESGKIIYSPESMNLKEFIADLIEKLELFDNGKHPIEFNFEGDTFIKSDPRLISILFNNIISNAIKYSPSSNKILVKVSRSFNLKIMIEDKGIGIPQEAIALLFEPFYRAKNSEKFKGSGLGLSIVKKIIDLLNGKIEIESEEGRGSKFLITLPLEKDIE